MSLNIQSLSQSTFSTFVPDETVARIEHEGASADFSGCVPPLTAQEEIVLCGKLEHQSIEKYLTILTVFLEGRTLESSRESPTSRWKDEM
jgi:hypothetical protein